jgi:hypothetical protein
LREEVNPHTNAVRCRNMAARTLHRNTTTAILAPLILWNTQECSGPLKKVSRAFRDTKIQRCGSCS